MLYKHPPKLEWKSDAEHGECRTGRGSGPDHTWRLDDEEPVMWCSDCHKIREVKQDVSGADDGNL